MKKNSHCLSILERFPEIPTGRAIAPLVFLHSLAGNAKHWTNQLAYFGSLRRTISIDLRGHGTSPLKSDNCHTIENLAEDVYQTLKSCKIEGCILVGHSFGASVAMALAANHPDLVRALVIVDANGDSTHLPKEAVDEIVGAISSNAYMDVMHGYWKTLISPNRNEVASVVFADLQKTPQELVVESTKALFAFKPQDYLDQYSGLKYAIVTEQNDHEHSAHRIARGFPFEVVPKTGHWIHLERPTEFNRLLGEFLETERFADAFSQFY